MAKYKMRQASPRDSPGTLHCVPNFKKLTLTYDLDLQSSVSYGHYLLTCKSSRSVVSKFRKESGKNGRTDIRTDRRAEAIALPPSCMRSVQMVTSYFLNNSVKNNKLICIIFGTQNPEKIPQRF